MRISSDFERNGLKTAVHGAFSLIGPVKILAAMSRVSEGYLSKCAGRDHPDFLPIDVALEADRLAQSPVITSALAALLGYRLVPLDGERGAEFTADHAFELVADAVALTKEVREADADGRRDAGERRAISNRINGQIKALQDALRAVNGEGA